MQLKSKGNPIIQEQIRRNKDLVWLLNRLGIRSTKKLEDVFSGEIPLEDIKTLAYSLMIELEMIFYRPSFKEAAQLTYEERTRISRSILNKFAEIKVIPEEDVKLYERTLSLKETSKMTLEQKIIFLGKEKGYEIKSCPKALLEQIDFYDIEAVVMKYSTELSVEEVEKVCLLAKNGFELSEKRMFELMSLYLKIGTLQPSQYNRLDEKQLDARIYNYLMSLLLKSGISIDEMHKLKPVCYSIAMNLIKEPDAFDIYRSLYPTDGSEPIKRSVIMAEKEISYEKLCKMVERVDISFEMYIPGFKETYNKFTEKKLSEKIILDTVKVR